MLHLTVPADSEGCAGGWVNEEHTSGSKVTANVKKKIQKLILPYKDPPHMRIVRFINCAAWGKN